MAAANESSSNIEIKREVRRRLRLLARDGVFARQGDILQAHNVTDSRDMRATVARRELDAWLKLGTLARDEFSGANSQSQETLCQLRQRLADLDDLIAEYQRRINASGITEDECARMMATLAAELGTRTAYSDFLTWLQASRTNADS